VPLLVVLAIGPLFEALPVSVLGCVTSCAILPLMKQLLNLESMLSTLSDFKPLHSYFRGVKFYTGLRDPDHADLRMGHCR